MGQIKNVLEKLGFTKNEAMVYNLLLKEGSSTAQEMYRSLGLNRVTVYEILKRFKEKGFVSLSKKASKQLYVLESPERLKEVISEKRIAISKMNNEIEELETVLQENFQQMKQIYEAKQKEIEVKFYRGLEEWTPERQKGATIQCKYHYLVMNRDFVNKWIPYDEERKKRVEKYLKNFYSYPNITLYTGSSALPAYITKIKNSTYIYLSQDQYPILAEIEVSDGGIYFYDTPGDKFKVIHINNKNIAQTLITLINMATETAKRDALHMVESKSKPPRKIV